MPMTREDHTSSPLPESHSEGSEDLMTAQDVDTEKDTTVVFVSRKRTLNLGGLVVIALVIGAITGVVWGIIQGVTSFGTIVLGALYGLMFVGGALALLVVLVDWVMERSRQGR